MVKVRSDQTWPVTLKGGKEDEKKKQTNKQNIVMPTAQEHRPTERVRFNPQVMLPSSLLPTTQDTG